MPLKKRCTKPSVRRRSFDVNKQAAVNTNGLIKKDDVLQYIDIVLNSGMGKKKSLEYVKKFIANQEDSTLYDFEEDSYETGNK